MINLTAVEIYVIDEKVIAAVLIYAVCFTALVLYLCHKAGGDKTDQEN